MEAGGTVGQWAIGKGQGGVVDTERAAWPVGRVGRVCLLCKQLQVRF